MQKQPPIDMEESSKKVSISSEELNELMACRRTLYDVQRVMCLCPKCKSYMLLDGYVCLGCGFDPTAKEEHE
jgi:hypothetical protein